MHTNNFSIITVLYELGNPQPAIQFHNLLLNEFLSEWRLRRKELIEGIITEEEYAKWMMNFPVTSDGCGKTEPMKKWRKSLLKLSAADAWVEARKRRKGIYLFTDNNRISVFQKIFIIQRNTSGS